MQALLSALQHLGLGIALVAQGLFPHPPTTPTPVVQKTTLQAQTFPTAPTSTKKPASASTKVTSVQKTTPKALPRATATSTATTPAVPLLPPPLPQSVVNAAARAALVNILCTTKSGGYLYPISGSGVIITKSGIILTNAHVGQYFLLRDYIVPDNVDCVVRTGSPASANYRAELLYLSTSWIAANASQISAGEAMGTGEHDFAFLRITGTTDPNGSLPASFPSLAITLDPPQRQEPVLIAGYPAGFLGGVAIATNLYISTALTVVSEIYAFNDEGNPDVMSVGGTVVTQAGASGGAIVRMQDGALQGIAATASEGATTDARDLRGITLAHISKSLAAEGKGGIVQLLSGDLAQKAASFNANVAPLLKQKLVDVLKR
jgi:hypothetical protein